MVYKLPQISHQELEAMFGIEDLKKTRFAQEMMEEGRQEGELAAKLQAVPRLMERGLSVEAIADILALSIEQVRKAAW